MSIQIKLNNTCLNCDRLIPIDFMLCSVCCKNALDKYAEKQGVKSSFDLSDVWKKKSNRQINARGVR